MNHQELLDDLMEVCKHHGVKLTAGIWNGKSVVLVSRNGELEGVLELVDSKRVEGVRWLNT